MSDSDRMPDCGPWQEEFSIGRLAELACCLEVTASKPGNVHRGADFDDAVFSDFLTSAIVMGQAIDESADSRWGETVLLVAHRTVRLVGTNTNLGMNLLITTLAKVASANLTDPESNKSLTSDAMRQYLQSLTLADAEDAFSAIRLMNPGGLGRVDEHDVSEAASISLVDAMKLAADRDLVAAQFVNGFNEVINVMPKLILDGRAIFGDLTSAIVYSHISMMALSPDTLIARKSGPETAKKSQALSQKALDTIEADPTLKGYWRAVSELDFWLRSDGRKRNPGTTADLVAAGLFVAIYHGQIVPPFR